MLSRCPYPDCLQELKIAEDLSFRKGHCSFCRRAITYRPLDVLFKIKKTNQIYQHAYEQCSAEAMGSVDTEKKQKSQHQFSTILEDIRSLYNVGSIFRTADGAGFSHLYLCGITGFPPNRQIEKTSLGAEKYIKWTYYSSTLEVIPKLKSKGVQIIGLEKNVNSQSLSLLLSSGKVRQPLCLIVGNEVTGLSAETLDNCDMVAHLPMYGKKESLNVAVAFGIAAYMLID